MPSRDRRPRLLAALVAAAALCIALPAFAVSVTAVRVGAHPTFTRIVFELDGRAGYQVEQTGTDAAPELRITIDAMSSARELRANGDVRGVKVDAGTKARAHITLRSSDLRVREIMLSDPPRIVIDLHKPETAVADAAKPVPKPKATAKETPAVEPAPKIAEKEAPKPETPKTVAKESPAPAPPPKVAEKEAPKPEPAPKVAAKETPPPAPIPTVTKEIPAPSPTPTPPPDSALIPAPRVAPAPNPVAPPVPPPAVAPPAEPTPDSVAKLPPPPIPAPPAVKPPAPVRPTPPPSALPKAGGSWIERVTSHPIWIGGGAVALLGLAALALRRRRALPNDLDVTAIAEEVEQTAETAESDAPGRIPSGGFAMGDDSAPSTSTPEEMPLSGLFDRPAAPAPTWPAPPPAATPASAAAEAAEDSLFDGAGDMPGEPDAREGDAPMNQEMDLPVDRRPSPPAARMGGSAAPSPDIARMLQDFERRIATLEARLDESNEAREKLERQVAAQSEELRVQRAAIARTQRALRTMTRGDEDKATEPALRDGDTQAKTRVTP
jgi:hypothetical protein